ncbi:MAG: acyl-CoA thioesterase [Acidimicrobiales bacterium]
MDVARLVEQLTVEAVADDHFTGYSPADRDRQVYGGQFLGQALMAASATVDGDRVPHSLHAYFVRSGAAHLPIEYRVERIRDGRTASHRSVVATQDGREMFRQLMSFQVPRPGLSYPGPVAIRPGLDPSTFPSYRHWVAELSDNRDHAWFAEDLPLDIRFENAPPPRPRAPMTNVLRIWMRLVGPVASDDPCLHASLVAWMSDKTISDVTLYPHGRSWTDTGSDILSLDHAMWFHQPVRADEWLLLTHEAAATRRGRGLARGDLVTLAGEVVGAVAQEALIVLPDAAVDEG